MDQKWIQVLVVLLFCQKFISAENILAEEGKEVSVNCDPKDGTMLFWFRVLDGSNMEFIISLSSNGFLKFKPDKFDTFFRNNSPKSLVLKSFNKTRDSGIYSCASLVNGNKLVFGPVTRLAGETKPVTPPPRHTTTQTSTTTKSCAGQEKPGSSMFCNPFILGALAGGCGLLLLLLIVTILYCNKIRTRRCPHHYKRRPRNDALEKQMMTNRHI